MTYGIFKSPYIRASLYLVSTDPSNEALTRLWSRAGNSSGGVSLGHGFSSSNTEGCVWRGGISSPVGV